MNYAVITKAKAMYGKLLTDAEYSELADCPSVSACCDYLKNHPAHKTAFDGIVIDSVNRSRAESILQNEYWLDCVRLLKGLNKSDRILTLTLLQSYEPKLIMWSIRNVDKSPVEKAAAIELYRPLLERYFSFDVNALINARSVREIADAISEKYKVSKELVESAEHHNDYLELGNEVWKTYYAYLGDLLKKKHKKDDSRILFGMSIDIYNIKRIFRLRLTFNYKKEQILPFVLQPTYRLTDAVIDELCNADSVADFNTILKKTPYKALSKAKSGVELENLTDEMRLQKAKKLLHFSTSAPAVVYGYMRCKSTEIKKITTVVESVRYKLSKEMIENYVGTKVKAN